MAESEFTYDAQFDAEVGLRDEEVPCQLVSGSAGTGKTYLMREKIQQEPSYGVLSSTTGISAINLGAVTVNSLLSFFDTDSLRDRFLTGQLTTSLHRLALEYDNLIIDEISMMDGRQLDYIYQALKSANGFKDVKRPMGLILVGDFAQLQPVRAPWAFEAECWEKFDANTLRLTKMWRQDQAEFLMALTAARRGDGDEAARMLTEAEVTWHTSLEMEFDGTTIVPKNDQVDRYNWEALSRVKGTKIQVRSSRWGKQRNEWKTNIPDAVDFKVGAYVMLLANKMEDGELVYANGDCGHVRDYQHGQFVIELVRTPGETVTVGQIIRHNAQRDRPDGWYGDEPKDGVMLPEWYPRPHRGREKKYVEGQVKFYPLRLAWASTVHRSQGLSLDRVQFDFRNHFAGQPAMCYVSLSRCRTLEGLRLVGGREIFAAKIKCDPRIKRWL